ncbi:hypothetical protein BDN72DRAFT_384969 [Pluteus cervinus]|uniref:Uncharacterized protein n=1 Tax=Pluteus cervinus TaxID=181527 RepID=A0ACD3AA73_9AGAR|nr:hypothetical protein BDN72DRAFT_384969 [Pluteus cervinus]
MVHGPSYWCTLVQYSFRAYLFIFKFTLWSRGVYPWRTLHTNGCMYFTTTLRGFFSMYPTPCTHNIIQIVCSAFINIPVSARPLRFRWRKRINEVFGYP